MRSKTEIEVEITALKALQPVAQYAQNSREIIKAVIKELQSGIDTTSAEFLELPVSLRFAVIQAQDWKKGLTELKPSADWGRLVK